MASERVRVVPWAEHSEFHPVDGTAVESVRCEEYISAGTGLTRFRIVRRLEEQVSAECETPDQAWASYDERKAAAAVGVPDAMIEAVQAANSHALDDAAVKRVLGPALLWLKGQESAKAELDALGHGIAYDASCSVIESNCVMDSKAETDEFYDWWDVATATESDAAEAVAEALKYLEARGLIERATGRPNVVSIRWESEATA